MTLGTGVFLAALCFGIIFLYSKTKDRWNWKKISLITGLSTLGPLILIIVWIYANEWIDDLPKVQNEYAGIQLGQSSADVIFLKGKPYKKATKPMECKCDSIYLYIDTSSYANRDPLTVRFKNDTVVGVIQYWHPSSYGYENIQGIDKNTSIERVKEKFGTPDTIIFSENNTERRWFYNKYHVRFGFEKGVVSNIGIFKPE